MKQDGSLVACGLNDFGQCDVPGGFGYVAVAAGRDHSLAIQVPEPSGLAGLLGVAAAALVAACRGRTAKRGVAEVSLNPGLTPDARR